MAVPVVGTYSAGGMTATNDGNGGLTLHIYQNQYNSTGTGEPKLIREIKLTTAQRLALIAVINDA